MDTISQPSETLNIKTKSKSASISIDTSQSTGDEKPITSKPKRQTKNTEEKNVPVPTTEPQGEVAPKPKKQTKKAAQVDEQIKVAASSEVISTTQEVAPKPKRQTKKAATQDAVQVDEQIKSDVVSTTQEVAPKPKRLPKKATTQESVITQEAVIAQVAAPTDVKITQEVATKPKRQTKKAPTTPNDVPISNDASTQEVVPKPKKQTKKIAPINGTTSQVETVITTKEKPSDTVIPQVETAITPKKRNVKAKVDVVESKVDVVESNVDAAEGGQMPKQKKTRAKRVQKPKVEVTESNVEVTESTGQTPVDAAQLPKQKKTRVLKPKSTESVPLPGVAGSLPDVTGEPTIESSGQVPKQRKPRVKKVKPEQTETEQKEKKPRAKKVKPETVQVPVEPYSDNKETKPKRQRKLKVQSSDATQPSSELQVATELDENIPKKRFFKVCYFGSSNNIPEGKYYGKKPKQAASKAFSTISKKLRTQNGGSECVDKISFYIIEYTKDLDKLKRKPLYYTGTREKLLKKVDVPLRDKEKNPIMVPKKDENGNEVKDENGNVVLEQKKITYFYHNVVMKDKVAQENAKTKDSRPKESRSKKQVQNVIEVPVATTEIVAQ